VCDVGRMSRATPQLVGIAFEASSTHCAARLRQLVYVSTTHDLFAIAGEVSDVVSVLRALHDIACCTLGRFDCACARRRALLGTRRARTAGA
jgi:hypothetical protein